MTRTSGDATMDAFSLPAGTVTFLLSDVEGSTRLWEHAPEAMAEAIPRHYELLSDAVGRHGGVRPEEQGEGDSIVAAFARASDAIAAALTAQRTMQAQSWPGGIEMRVRIALHTAEAQLRDEGNYFGAALSRCARLRGIAHGGQTVLSRTTHDLVVDRLPEGTSLLDLGVHRLRDLGRPEHVFALAHPDLPADFEALRSLDAVPNNLPGQLTSFVGRDDELASVRDALQTARLLTLTGAGGCGKTRLAAQAAADAIDRFPDGAWWVELAPVADPELVPQALAEALSVRPLPGQSALEAVVAHLAGRRALVVLDNCEHALEACAAVADSLLRGCPDVALLATSRAPLATPGETAWRVPSLSLPADRTLDPVDSLAQSDAVRLFIERAVQVRPNFAVNAANAPAIAQICHDLDGIPLAIELAAARVRVLGVDQIAEGLADRFRLLTGGARSAMPRQRTLRASVDWSHELLTDAERALLRRLSVFTGGWTLDAIEHVCSEPPLAAREILDLLTSLVDKSLVVVDEALDGNVRYRLLETVRQYALDRLNESGETPALRARHRAWFVALAERAEPHLVTPDQPRWMDLLDADAANLSAAADDAVATDADAALRLCSALTLFWKLRGRFAEADRLYAQTLDAIAPEPSAGRARLLWAKAYLGVYAGRYEEAVATAQEALGVATDAGDAWSRARALDVLATIMLFVDPVQSGSLAKQSRALAREAGDDWCWTDATQIAAYALLPPGRYDEALALMAECRPVIERMGYAEFVAWNHYLDGLVATERGDVAAAATALTDGATAAGVTGEPASGGMCIGRLGYLDVYRGDPHAALRRLEPALQHTIATGAGMALPYIQHAVAVAQGAAGQLEAARATFAQLHAASEGTDVYLHPFVCAGAALVQLTLGAVDDAARSADRACEHSDAIGNVTVRAAARHARGLVALQAGELERAEELLHEALTLRVESGLLLEAPESMDALALVALRSDAPEEAARAFGAAAALRAAEGLHRWHPGWQAVAEEEARLRADGHEEAYAAGAALQPSDAVEWIRRARGTRARPASGWAALTPTEQQVAGFAAQGLTNPEIGERMFIARGTVKIHLSRAYAKLGVANRTELAALLARR